jgi:hypothetical protein
MSVFPLGVVEIDLLGFVVSVRSLVGPKVQWRQVVHALSETSKVQLSGIKAIVANSQESGDADGVQNLLQRRLWSSTDAHFIDRGRQLPLLCGGGCGSSLLGSTVLLAHGHFDLDQLPCRSFNDSMMRVIVM